MACLLGDFTRQKRRADGSGFPRIRLESMSVNPDRRAAHASAGRLHGLFEKKEAKNAHKSLNNGHSHALFGKIALQTPCRFEPLFLPMI
jgi:hypothetical protein